MMSLPTLLNVSMHWQALIKYSLMSYLTKLPLLAPQGQKCSDGLQATTYTTLKHKLTWSIWNQARVVDSRW
jgi:hypothetical protein